MMSTKNIMRVSSVSLILLLFITVSFTECRANEHSILIEEEGRGPLVDNIIWKVITQDDQQVLALQDNEIDIIGDTVDPVFLETLQEAENIDVSTHLRNGYAYMVINCDKYPLNITAFRRALAFAVDKFTILDYYWTLPELLDSPIPRNNPFSIEGQLPYSYYDPQIEIGNLLLDQAGFEINATTGFRMAPDGSPFDVLIEVAQGGMGCSWGQPYADALQAMQVDAVCTPTDFYDYLNRLYFHGDYDIVFLGSTFNNFDVDWLAYEFWSGNVNEPYHNFANFQNATFDSWCDQLVNSTDYDEVYEAAIAMQEILVYECPWIISYQNQYLSAYRTDRFEGFVNDGLRGVTGWWTKYQAHLQDSEGGPFGGTLRFSNPLDIDSFNFMVSTSAYAYNINELLFDSLLRLGPDGNDIPWLAESYSIESSEDNPDVPSGHTRFTFDILQNATWTDGMPLTAEDIAFTLNYYREAPECPYGVDLVTMVSAHAPTLHTLVVEFNTESYWHLHSIAYKLVLPKHVFEVIGLDGWNTWHPNPPITPMVTSGPFNVSDYVAGEFCELTWNPNYFYHVNPSTYMPEVTPPTNETETVSDTDDLIPFDFPGTPVGFLVTSTSIFIIVGVIILWKKEDQNT